jgi:sigma-E factor negative regulatory protein RseA
MTLRKYVRRGAFLQMKEQLSAMMDDAAADRECERCVRYLKTDLDLRNTWDLYHLIGDTLRGHTAPDIADRVRDRLAAEPVVLAPRATARPMRRASWVVLSAAASVAAVAFVGWMALPLFEVAPKSPGPVVQSDEPVAIVEPLQAAVPAPEGINDYLLAHQRFSPGPSIGGIAPYVRSVGDERRSR